MAVQVLISGCANVPIVDHAFYGDLVSDGATEFHFLTSETHDYDKPTWDSMRGGMICEQPDVFADWKADLEKLCSISNRCTYQQKQALQDFYSRVQSVQKRVTK